MGKETTDIMECLERINESYLVPVKDLDHYIGVGLADFLRLFRINREFAEFVSGVAFLLENKRNRQFYEDIIDFAD